MKTKVFKIITIILTAAFGLSLLVPAPTTYAKSVCEMKGQVSDEVYRAAGCGDNKGELKNVVITIINAIIAVSGIVAVIFVIVGGINYMTSTGEPQKTKKAKDTILYACIGLVITALSFAIVNFVISGLIGGQAGNQSNDQQDSQDADDNNSGSDNKTNNNSNSPTPQNA